MISPMPAKRPGLNPMLKEVYRWDWLVRWLKQHGQRNKEIACGVHPPLNVSGGPCSAARTTLNCFNAARTADRCAEAVAGAPTIGYKGLYTIEVSQDAAVRVIYNAILANLA